MGFSKLNILCATLACGVLSAGLSAREQAPKPPKNTKPEVQQPLSTEGERPGHSPSAADDDFGGKVNLDDVGSELIKRLKQGEKEAADAAFKLSQMGKRMVPPLSSIVLNSKNETEKYWATLSLSRIRNKAAAQALLPILRDEKADIKLRMLAVESASGENLDEAAPDLIKLARGKDSEMRSKCLSALSVMIQSWPACESLFIESLDDTSSDVRMLAVTVCLQAAVYKTPFRRAEDKLMGMLKNEEIPAVRYKVMAALGRMKSPRTVKVLVEMLADPELSAPMQKQCLNTLQTITDVPLRDQANAASWWDKFGKSRYENAAPLVLPEDLIKAADPTLAKKTGDDSARTEEPADTLTPKTQAPTEPTVKAPPVIEKPYKPARPAPKTPPANPEPPAITKRESEMPPPAETARPKKKKMMDDDGGEKPFSGVSIE